MNKMVADHQHALDFFEKERRAGSTISGADNSEGSAEQLPSQQREQSIGHFLSIKQYLIVIPFERT